MEVQHIGGFELAFSGAIIIFCSSYFMFRLGSLAGIISICCGRRVGRSIVGRDSVLGRGPFGPFGHGDQFGGGGIFDMMGAMPQGGGQHSMMSMQVGGGGQGGFASQTM